MYKLNEIDPANIEPWQTTLGKRIGQLREYLSQDCKVGVLLYELADTSTFRYRCYNLAQISAADPNRRFLYFFQNELEHLLPYLNTIDSVTLVRMRWTHRLADFVYQVKSTGTPVIFDTDDLICDLDSIPLIMSTLDVSNTEADYSYWFAYISRLYMTAKLADAVTTTNDFLAERLSGLLGVPAAIIPNFLNHEQLQISKQLQEQKENFRSQQPFTLGYFSGTPSHINDFKLVASELIHLLNQYPDMRLMVVGFMEYPAEMQELIQSSQIIHEPLTDFCRLQGLIASVDVNLVPLVVNGFTNCKSELKFFEAAIVDTLTIASPTFTYKNAIQHGDNGFLASEGDWGTLIEDIYNERIDYCSLSKQAREDVLARYQGTTIIQAINNSYDQLLRQLN